MPEIQLQAAFKMPPQFVSFIPKSCGGDIIHEMAIKCHLIYIEEWGKRKDLFYVNFFLTKAKLSQKSLQQIFC